MLLLLFTGRPGRVRRGVCSFSFGVWMFLFRPCLFRRFRLLGGRVLSRSYEGRFSGDCLLYGAIFFCGAWDRSVVLPPRV